MVENNLHMACVSVDGVFSVEETTDEKFSTILLASIMRMHIILSAGGQLWVRQRCSKFIVWQSTCLYLGDS